MNKTFLVALREYVDNIRTKAFWIGILAFPVILVLATLVPIMLEKTRDVRKYSVVDDSGWLLEAIDQQADARDFTRLFKEVAYRYTSVGKSLDELPPVLREMAPELDRLSPVQRRSAARLLAGLAVDSEANPEAALPPATVASLKKFDAPLHQWWDNLSAEAAGNISRDLDRSKYQRVRISNASGDLRSELNSMITSGKLFAYFVINANPVVNSEGSIYVSNNLTDQDLKNWFSSLATDVVRNRRLDDKGLDQATARWIQAPVTFTEKKVSATGAEAEVRTQDTLRQWAPVVFVYLLWISVFSIAQMLLNNTIEEKSNRIIEVLLSSVSPLELMTGKIMGIAATGLTMVGSWVLFFIGMVQLLPLLLGGMPSLPLGRIAGDPFFLVSFVVYFLMGYLFYAAILVGIGSVCNSLKEAQNLFTPVMMILIIPILTMMPVAKDPNGTLAKVLSFIPTFTPFVMMNRAAAPPTFLEYILTTIIMILAIGAAFWGAAKIFRIGILMTGKPPKPLEMLRWLKTNTSTVPARPEE